MKKKKSTATRVEYKNGKEISRKKIEIIKMSPLVKSITITNY